MDGITARSSTHRHSNGHAGSGVDGNASVESEDVCWICLDERSDGNEVLMSPCACPRKVHPKCLARWQLQQAGRAEETHCRFCNHTLSDWKASLTPESLKPEVKRVQPIMVVYFEGEIHRIPVRQGGDGLNDFTLRIRQLFNLPEDVDISLTFGCKEPMSGQHLKLEGTGAFDAAVHCASVAAADRVHKLKAGNLETLANGTAVPASPHSRAPTSAPGNLLCSSSHHHSTPHILPASSPHANTPATTATIAATVTTPHSPLRFNRSGPCHSRCSTGSPHPKDRALEILAPVQDVGCSRSATPAPTVDIPDSSAPPPLIPIPSPARPQAGHSHIHNVFAACTRGRSSASRVDLPATLSSSCPASPVPNASPTASLTAALSLESSPSSSHRHTKSSPRPRRRRTVVDDRGELPPAPTAQQQAQQRHEANKAESLASSSWFGSVGSPPDDTQGLGLSETPHAGRRRPDHILETVDPGVLKVRQPRSLLNFCP
ncbi:MAG: hypothetical protein WDW38_002929 [Sanguina aurantia]